MKHALFLPLLLLALFGCSANYFIPGGETNEKVLQNGKEATAEVMAIEQTGAYINNDPVIKFTLKVHAKGIAPYSATTYDVIPMIAIPQIQPGKELPVKYNPKNPKEVALDIFETD